ncbi:hypothetical protein V6N12_045211 [Hibiscus sabdariffa]|uniref:Uncharacterized protein n=1 Tax=Hibiscus sabdariffa TaxID=183260 RepID=A0ABR2G2U3_9ROSI
MILSLRNLSCKVERIDVSTLSTDEGQDDTGPVILKRCGNYPAFAKITRHGSILEVGRITVLTLSTDEGQDDTDEGQDDTGPAILKRCGNYPAFAKITRHGSILEVGRD